MKEFKLCYVEGHKAWFTSDFEHQWGDDWDDKPYEYNAEEPYEHWFDAEGEHPIELKTLYFETNDWDAKEPCDVGRFSVEDINKKAIAWIHTGKYNILAETTIEDFIKTIEENGGKIYVERSK